MSTTPLPPFDEETLALLSDHLDGQLDAAADAALRQRLADEPELAAELEALRAVGAALREDTARLPGAPEGFLTGVREAIARGDARARDGRPKMLRLLGAAYAAAALLIVGWTIGWYVDRGSDHAPATQSADVPEKAAPVVAAPRATFETAPSETWAEGDLGALRDEAAAPLPTAAAPSAASPPRPASAQPVFGAPGASVDRGQRKPSDEPAAGLAKDDAPLGLGGGGGGSGDAVPPRKLLVVRAKDVEAFVAWLSLVQADQPTSSARDVGVVDARLARADQQERAPGTTSLRLVLDGADWRRLFGRLGLDAEAADAPRGETSLDVEVRASDR